MEMGRNSEEKGEVIAQKIKDDERNYYLNKARRIAHTVVTDIKYDIVPSLGLTEIQKDLFELYFTDYALNKTDTDNSFIRRFPGFSFFGKTSSMAESQDEIKKEARESLHAEIIAKRNVYTAYVDEQVVTSLTPDQHNPETKEQLVARIGEEAFEAKRMQLNKAHGSPESIRNAANLLSSDYFNPQLKGKEKERKIIETRNRINIRNW